MKENLSTTVKKKLQLLRLPRSCLHNRSVRSLRQSRLTKTDENPECGGDQTRRLVGLSLKKYLQSF